MEKLLLAMAFLAVASAQTDADCTPDTCCKLTQSAPRKPFPSLTQCYKYNTNTGACCKSGHDQHIKNEYSALLSDTCLREFVNLEFYFCLGCNEKQYDFVTNKPEPILRVCKTFADMLFSPPDSEATANINSDSDPDSYERCGLNMKVQNKDTDPAAFWVPGHFIHAESFDRQVVMPFHVFANASQFLDTLKPPFFEEYKIQIVDTQSADYDVTKDGECFNAASPLRLVSSAVMLAVLAHLGATAWFV